ncbi:PREDICTED: protein enabled homolog [Nelumbo nucifera]|uniref:Protein enabled homolog n=1 Tax=Nelumbo nucifera TaxID=4432 RepID=A0A1U7YYM6_NELNU|nr:PREDICTED: protein enabled homolog [Nelumbo nucifera]
MDSQRSPLLGRSFFFQGKTEEELRHSLLCTTLELETTRVAAQEEIRKREDQTTHLKDLLSRAIRERDEAQDKCQTLLMEKLLLLQQQQQQQQQQLYQQPQQTTPLSGVSSIEDETRRGGDSNTGISSSDCEESIVSSPVMDPIPLPPLPPAAAAAAATTTITTVQLVPKKPLPEKGKLLQAVMKAGPLLQTLLLAGPLPQWRYPPPPLDSTDIPPVAIPSPPPPSYLLHQQSFINGISDDDCGSIVNKRKRDLIVCEGSDSSTKYQRVLQ